MLSSEFFKLVEADELLASELVERGDQIEFEEVLIFLFKEGEVDEVAESLLVGLEMLIVLPDD